MKAELVKNWLTTGFGVLAGLPILALGAWQQVGLGTLPPAAEHWLRIIAAIGIIGLGIVSKAVNVHSTASEVAASTQAEAAQAPRKAA